MAESLQADIGAGRLAPGDRVPPIRALAARFGVSSSTAQNALAVLREQGLIRSASPRGYLVSDDAASAINGPETAGPPGQLNAVLAELRQLTARVERLEGDARSSASRTDRTARRG